MNLLRKFSSATAAVSGADPVSGQPYAPEYTGLPTELAELQKRLVAEKDADVKQDLRILIAEAEHAIFAIAELVSFFKEGVEGALEMEKALRGVDPS